MKKYDYIAAACFIALGSYVLYETGTYEINGIGQRNPAIWPRILAISMIAVSVLLIITTALKKEKTAEQTENEKMSDEEPAQVIDWKSPGMIKVFESVGLIGLFIVVMNIFGMLIGLLMLIPGIMWLMNCRSKKMLIILPTATVLFVYVFFVKLLTITLPGGLFF